MRKMIALRAFPYSHGRLDLKTGDEFMAENADAELFIKIGYARLADPQRYETRVMTAAVLSRRTRKRGAAN